MFYSGAVKTGTKSWLGLRVGMDSRPVQGQLDQRILDEILCQMKITGDQERRAKQTMLPGATKLSNSGN